MAGAPRPLPDRPKVLCWSHPETERQWNSGRKSFHFMGLQLFRYMGRDPQDGRLLTPTQMIVLKWSSLPPECEIDLLVVWSWTCSQKALTPRSLNWIPNSDFPKMEPAPFWYCHNLWQIIKHKTLPKQNKSLKYYNKTAIFSWDPSGLPVAPQIFSFAIHIEEDGWASCSTWPGEKEVKQHGRPPSYCRT